MAKALTQIAIDNLKSGAARREVPDGKIGGLYLIVQKSGAMSWAVRYRADGKPRKFTIGACPKIELSAARRLAQRALSDVAEGMDPAAIKQAKLRAAAFEQKEGHNRIEKVVETFIERHAKIKTRESTWRETERILRKEVLGAWAGRRLGGITRANVHDLLDAILDRPAPILANRTLAVLRRMCAWAVERGIIASSPCDKVKAPAVEKSRDRVLSEDEIRHAWCAFERVGWPFGALAKLLVLTAARRDEVASMRWSEINFADRTWTIAKERTKNGVAHEVPLSDAAVRVLESLPRIGNPLGGLVFTTNSRAAVSGFSRAKATIDAAIVEARRKDAEACGGDLHIVTAASHWTFHDLRRSAASGMAGLGVAPHVIEAVLNHQSGTIRGIARVYNRYNYSNEKRSALERWSAHIEGLVEGRPAKVVALDDRRAAPDG